VVYRLCQLWFSLWQEPPVNGALAEALAEVPSHKFVPLVYQIASRLGAGTGAAAAFQVRACAASQPASPQDSRLGVPHRPSCPCAAADATGR
jgi:hypothetical protein